MRRFIYASTVAILTVMASGEASAGPVQELSNEVRFAPCGEIAAASPAEDRKAKRSTKAGKPKKDGGANGKPCRNCEPDEVADASPPAPPAGPPIIIEPPGPGFPVGNLPDWLDDDVVIGGGNNPPIPPPPGPVDVVVTPPPPKDAPEPSTIVLLGAGLLGLAGLGRRRS